MCGKEKKIKYEVWEIKGLKNNKSPPEEMTVQNLSSKEKNYGQKFTHW
jgi:hypothetical protein